MEPLVKTGKSLELVSLKAPSYMFGRVLNTPLTMIAVQKCSDTSFIYTKY